MGVVQYDIIIIITVRTVWGKWEWDVSELKYSVSCWIELFQGREDARNTHTELKQFSAGVKLRKFWSYWSCMKL
jgi:hypothetical protein